MVSMPGCFARAGWAALAVFCAALVGVSVLLTELYQLHPCVLCVFQRVIFLLLVPLFLLMAATWPRPSAVLVGGLTLLVASGGLAVGAYQSWLQWQEASSNAAIASCGPGSYGPIEQLIDWLGMRWPQLFFASGSCGSKEMEIMGLSFANWAALIFAGLAIVVGQHLVAVLRRRPPSAASIAH